MGLGDVNGDGSLDILTSNASANSVSVLLGKPYPEEELIAHIRRAMSRVRTESSGLSENVPGSTRGGLDAPV